MRLKAVLGAVVVSVGGMLLPQAALADEAMLMTCMAKYKAMGVSPDVALGECKKTTLAGCIKRLTETKYQAQAIKEEGGRSLIDLGNTDSRWLEGKQWKALGCSAYTQGPYRRQSDHQPSFWNNNRSYEWFRQGWCNAKTIELEQPYSLIEAKIACESGVAPVAKMADDEGKEDLVWDSDI